MLSGFCLDELHLVWVICIYSLTSLFCGTSCGHFDVTQFSGFPHQSVLELSCFMFFCNEHWCKECIQLFCHAFVLHIVLTPWSSPVATAVAYFLPLICLKKYIIKYYTPLFHCRLVFFLVASTVSLTFLRFSLFLWEPIFDFRTWFSFWFWQLSI